MKKLWKLMSLLLVIALLAGTVALVLSGCGKTDETVEEEGEFPLAVEGFQVGFCRMEMNPKQSAPLTGFGNDKFRYFNYIQDGGMTCSAVAISDAYGNHYMWMTSDNMSADAVVTSLIRKGVSQKTGIPEDNFIIAVSHSHSAPTTSRSDLQGSMEYRQVVIDRHIEAAVNALKDRKPAQLYVGGVETDRLNFIKHYYHVTLEGEVKHFGDNYGVAVIDETTDHVAESDPTMHLVKFVREGEKDIIVTNFRGHSHFTDGHYKYDLSADCWVSFRDALENYTGDHVVFFQGACGNTNTKTRLVDEARTNDMRTYGNLLAQHAVEGLDNNMRLIEDPKIEFKHIVFEAQINHSMDHLYAQATAVQQIWTSTGDPKQLAHLLTQDGTGIRSQYHASNIMANFKRTVAKDGQLQIKAMSISDEVGLCTFPGELFEAISVGMEDNSPFEMTMLFGYADHYVGYMPTAAAWEYTCYETDMAHFEDGTGERLLETYLELLNEIHSRY